MSELLTLVRSLKTHLQILEESGIESFPATRAPIKNSLQSKREGEAPTALLASEDRALPVRARGVGASEDLPQADRTGPHIGSSATQAPTLDAIRAELGECTRCRLHERRAHIVFGVGNPKAELVFVGEAPGEEEDRQGIPFVGAAGQLLTKMIRAMGLTREQVYIANVVKCRPPGNRDPLPDEVETCRPFLEEQLVAIRPKVICTLGKHASQTLLNTTERITRLRGRVHDRNGTPVVPTFHPAYLLRNESDKKLAWMDLQLIMKLLRS